MTTYTFTTIDDPSGDAAHGNTVGAINATGEVAGTYWDLTGDNGYGSPHGFVYDPNTNPASWTSIDDGSVATYVLAIDAAGDVAGYYQDSLGGAHEFVDFGGTFTTLLYTNPVNAAMNSSGEVASWYYPNSNENAVGFTYFNGSYAFVSDPNAGTDYGEGTQIEAINDAGVVGGVYLDANYHQNGFTYNPATQQYTTIDDPLAIPADGGTVVEAINNGGENIGPYKVAGIYYDSGSNNPHGFIYDSGTQQYTTIDDPNAVYGTFVTGINDSGEVAGNYYDASGNPHGFVYDPGTQQYTTIEDPNAAYGTFISAINDDGWVAGTYRDSGYVTHDFEATPCYCPGTLIRTASGEVPVEELAIGDKVVTMKGEARPIKWIGRRNYGGRFVMGRKDVLPVCIKAGALADNVPRRDLWISPNHAMYFKDLCLDGALIEAKDIVNGVSIVQAESVEKIEYVHIELETHDVIVAEGALAESFIDDDSRGMFHNRHEYLTLYPDAATGFAQYCAPRLSDGYEVEAARRRIALRAGLRHDEQPAGGLRGYIDHASPRSIAGWAQSMDHPEVPVCLDIYAGGRLIGQILANRHREDLKHAGIGSGRHGFEFTPSPGSTFAPATVQVRRSRDGAAIEFSPKAKRALGRTVGRGGSADEHAGAAQRHLRVVVHRRAVRSR
jgi:Hint domain